MKWFLTLNEEDQEFVKQFILSSGSLKELAKIYGVSYPTIRLRLNQVIQMVRMHDSNQHNGFESKIMQLVLDEKISLETAKEIIKEYKEEKND
ncbi:DUF2089 family protein [uncultured Enterococcus sp.]|uniref:DUF2089 family protein n=1 Tax=uncultured Enterococcus sp. TaxID=167972 RepID=UPI0025EF1274|nr:DUF2089 family protein [uncultured Enterococcus sp.]